MRHEQERRISTTDIRLRLGYAADTPILDARVGRRVNVIEADCKAGVPADAFHCAGVCSIMRTDPKCKGAVIWPTIALVGELDKRGNEILMRYEVPAATRRYLVKKQDNPRSSPRPGGFDLLPVHRSGRVEVRRRADKARHAANAKSGRKPRKRKNGGRSASNYNRPTWLRSGAGQVHY